jgi:hypothetical protein
MQTLESLEKKLTTILQSLPQLSDPGLDGTITYVKFQRDGKIQRIIPTHQLPAVKSILDELGYEKREGSPE